MIRHRRGYRHRKGLIVATPQLFDVISISAGLRGLQVLLAPVDYIRVTEANLALIAKDKE